MTLTTRGYYNTGSEVNLSSVEHFPLRSRGRAGKAVFASGPQVDVITVISHSYVLENADGRRNAVGKKLHLEALASDMHVVEEEREDTELD
ncbi:hypothetical protein WMY93_029417 [Mugilogobius chulae]|uniref:Uncharacterized protein n=1 Tax=Mugilogobius chulae TaxID=88201 RepID=A0AAW0MXX6_9GOBI